MSDRLRRHQQLLEGLETPSATVPPASARSAAQGSGLGAMSPTPGGTLSARLAPNTFRISESPFYREGVENVDPPQLHYLHVGGWATSSCDYFIHRRPREGEKIGHTLFWLHTAKPRDRFIFLIMPVEGGRPILTPKERLYQLFFGIAPRYALSRRAHRTPAEPGQASTPAPRRIPGVEVVEVLHSDITALDYSPALTTNRLSIETRRATTRWMASRAAAEEYYGCEPQRTFQMARTPEQKPASVSANSSFSPAPAFTLPTRQQDVVTKPNGGSKQSPVDAAECGTGNAGRMPPAGASFSREESKISSDAESRVASPLGGTQPMVEPAAVTFFSPPREIGFFDSLPRYHENTMIVVYSQDPHFNAVLREVLQPTEAFGATPARSLIPAFAASVAEQSRLLSLYEAGIPSWCIFFCRWGLPYRRWFRIVAVTTLNTWPFIALLVGLYDLYKHMPYLREWAGPFVDWMECHFTLRVSVAVAYIFTVIFAALSTFVRFAKSIGAVFSFFVYPLHPLIHVASICGTMFQYLGALIATFGSSAFGLLWALKALLMPVSQGVKTASSFALLTAKMFRFWAEVARPVKNLLKAIYDGIVHIGTQIARREASLRMWYSQLPVRLWHSVERWGAFVRDETRAPTWRSVAVFLAVAVVLFAMWYA